MQYMQYDVVMLLQTSVKVSLHTCVWFMRFVVYCRHDVLQLCIVDFESFVCILLLHEFNVTEGPFIKTAAVLA